MPLRQSEDCTRVFISVRDAEEATRVVVNAMVNKKEAFGAVARSQYHSHTCALSTTVATCALSTLQRSPIASILLEISVRCRWWI